MVTYKKLTYDGNKIQVDSAIRDGNGAQIDTTYLKKMDVWMYEYTIATSSSDTTDVKALSVPTGVTPRIVQLFVTSSGNNELIQADASLTVADNTWSCSVGKPADSGTWTVRIFGWA